MLKYLYQEIISLETGGEANFNVDTNPFPHPELYTVDGMLYLEYKCNVIPDSSDT